MHKTSQRLGYETENVSLNNACEKKNNRTRRGLLYHIHLPAMATADSISNGYDLIYKWFDHLKSKGHYIAGYVIMPNHIHVVIAFRNTGQSINTIIGNGKRFIAYGIIKKLQQQDNQQLLHHLAMRVKAKDRTRNKKHEVWEDSFDWKGCRSNSFIQQKLDYIHNNPCKGKWELAAAPIAYPHSSAKYYITDEQGIYEVFNYCRLADIDLTKPGSNAETQLK